MESLLLMLGVGPLPRKNDDPLERKYNEATYYFPKDPTRAITTPFVAEALVKLFPGRFGALHIFGTQDSMWHTLYLHATGGTMTEAQELVFWDLAEGIEDRSLVEGTASWCAMENLLTDFLGVPTSAHLIPLPSTEDDIWSILQIITSADINDGTVSIDITHGLRVHPVFLLVSLFYLRSVRPNLTVGSVFYGALELGDRAKRTAPLLDMSPIITLMDWIEAAGAFARYGDAAPIADLLRRENRDDLNQFARRARYLSHILQFNLLGDIGRDARKLIEAMNRLDREVPAPLSMVRDALSSFPRALAADQPTWGRYLKTARFHLDNQRQGLAALAAWEAVMWRLADLYGIQKRTYEVDQMLGKIARHRGLNRSDLKPHTRTREIQKFQEKMRRLGAIRNAIAHADQTDKKKLSDPNQTNQQLEHLIAFLEKSLSASWLEELPDCYPKKLFSTHAPG